MSTPIPIRTVDGSLQHLRLNFRNQIFHSFVTSFAKDEEDSGLSVKMVIAGTGERYKIGERNHQIVPGRFLVVNHHQRFQCRVQANEAVEGMCFYIDPASVQEVNHFARAGHRRMLDEAGNVNSTTPVFTEKVFGLTESTLGNFLQAMTPILRDSEKRKRVNFDEFFITMAEHLVHSEFQTKLMIDSLKNEKPSTREELYRRISLAKCHIDEHYLQELNLDTLAEVAMTSKYHFLRCFKEIYHCSPYHYVLQKRLQHTAHLLLKDRHSLTEIALETGFTDRRAFNKAFKKMYGTLPTAFRTEK
ncbi:MAG: helix-turn-helix transcriptional regulator [Bacteroidetes bacterium]|nr:helix-turn-helix transcriptional regulator [Bacteroidota bacterium]